MIRVQGGGYFNNQSTGLRVLEYSEYRAEGNTIIVSEYRAEGPTIFKVQGGTQPKSSLYRFTIYISDVIKS